MLSRTLTTLIVEDHPHYLNGLVNYLIRNFSNLKIETASNGEQAQKLILSKNYDIAIIDIGLPKICGIEVAKLIKSRYCDTIVITNSFNYDINQLDLLNNIGVDSILLKSDEEHLIIESIKTTLKKNKYYSKTVQDQLDKNTLIVHKLNLTDVEKEIAILICKGFSSNQIANKRNISINTVFTHRKKIFSKCNVHNTAELYW